MARKLLDTIANKSASALPHTQLHENFMMKYMQKPAKNCTERNFLSLSP